MARYRKIYPKLWTEPDFMKLNPLAQLGVLYCFCGPMSNAVGIYHCPRGVLEGAVRWSFGYCPGCQVDHGGHPDSYNNSPFVEMIESGLVDSAQDMIWIPSWWKWNAPDNPNVATNLARQLDDIELGDLALPYAERLVAYLHNDIAAIFLDQLRMLGHTFPDTYPVGKRKRKGKSIPYRKPFPKPVANSSPNQEQEQEQEQEEEQDIGDTKVSPRQSAKPQTDWDAVLERWNVLAEKTGRPKVKSLSHTRRTHYLARLKQDPEFWTVVELEVGRLSEFHRSKTWLTFDWIIKSPDNFLKLAEGNYRDDGRGYSDRQETVVERIRREHDEVDEALAEWVRDKKQELGEE